MNENNIRFDEMNNGEKRYYAMLMRSPFAISVTKGKEMVISLANDRMKDLWGKGSDIEGKKLFDVLPELIEQKFPEIINNVYTTGISFHANELLAQLNRNGTIEDRYFDVVYQPYEETDQTISGVTTIAYDVTEQVFARKKLEASELHFRKLADLMPAKVSNADAMGNVTYFNQGWLDYTGMSFEELRDFGYHKIMHPDEIEEFQKRLNSAKETGTTLEMEMRFMNRDGNYKWHLNLASPILDADANVTMWIGSTTEMHDQILQKTALEAAVKERTAVIEKANLALLFGNEEKAKKAEELFVVNHNLILQNKENERRTAELIIANKELQAFNYVSSHDLQEPLRKIQMFAALILDKEKDNLTETGKANFMRMKSAADLMRQLIEDLLLFSRTNAAERKFERIDAHAIIEELKTTFHDEIIEKKATIEVIEACPITIIHFQFRQLLHNLISNSLKFCHPDQSPKITIKCKLEKGSELNAENLLPKTEYCHIKFTDNCIGFEPQYKNRIFEVFQRLHSHEKYKGTGIGLAIVKKIVENHNGVISATSELDKGTTFDIYIPQ